jgi:hypothetical protein
MLDYLTYPLGLYVKLYYNVVVWVEKVIHDATINNNSKMNENNPSVDKHAY